MLGQSGLLAVHWLSPYKHTWIHYLYNKLYPVTISFRSTRTYLMFSQSPALKEDNAVIEEVAHRIREEETFHNDLGQVHVT